MRALASRPGSIAGAAHWDGRARGGRRAVDGTHQVLFTAQDAAGNRRSLRVPVRVDRTAGWLRWAPSAFYPPVPPCQPSQPINVPGPSVCQPPACQIPYKVPPTLAKTKVYDVQFRLEGDSVKSYLCPKVTMIEGSDALVCVKNEVAKTGYRMIRVHLGKAERDYIPLHLTVTSPPVSGKPAEKVQVEDDITASVVVLLVVIVMFAIIEIAQDRRLTSAVEAKPADGR